MALPMSDPINRRRNIKARTECSAAFPTFSVYAIHVANEFLLFATLCCKNGTATKRPKLTLFQAAEPPEYRPDL